MKVAGRGITKYGLALLAIVLIGLFLRLYDLGTQSIWWDEAYSVLLSKMSLSQIVQATGTDVHPPLYYFILHYWVTLFGTSEVAVRLLSVLFGVLAIPMIYLVGRQLFDEKVGLVAAFILAFSSFNIYYSQEARMYSLMVLLALLSMYFFLRFLQRNNLALSAAYVLSTTLLVYSHNYGWFVVIAQNIWILSLLLLSKNRTFRLRRWVALQATVLVLFVPWIPVAIGQISYRNAMFGGLSGLSPPAPLQLISTFFVYSGYGVTLAVAALAVLFAMLSVLSIFAYEKPGGSINWKAPLKALKSYSWKVRIQDVAPASFLIVWLLTINLLPFIISRFSSNIYDARYTIAASLALYLLVAKGIRNFNYRPVKLAVIAVIVVLSVANLQVYYTSTTRPNVRAATSLIDANAENGDVVLIVPGYQEIVFDYYNNRTDVAVKPIYFQATPSINRSEDKAKEIQSYVNGHDRVWLFAERLVDGGVAESFTTNLLNESYAIKYNESYYVRYYHSYNVYLFERRT